MTLDADTVKHIAELSRLEVTDNELEKVTHDLAGILELVEQLGAVDIADLEPMAHPLDMTQRLRPDAVTESDRREQFQAVAPAVDEGLYLVPKVIE
ncbi:MAG: Asp-tRNA(Asn)/Glu-tRNA(Gln) amidotransferase subunit GatC [Pseudomonadota bacterium]